MGYQKDLYIILSVSSMVIIHSALSSSLAISPSQRFWTRSVRNIDAENDFQKLLREYQTSSQQVLFPSEKTDSYGKWWFLQNSVPSIIQSKNFAETLPSSDTTMETTNDVEDFIKLIRDNQMINQISPLSETQNDDIARQRWQNIILKV